MSYPITPGPPEPITNHHELHNRLEQFAKKNGSTNGYLVVNKSGNLERVSADELKGIKNSEQERIQNDPEYIPIEKYIEPRRSPDVKNELKFAFIHFLSDNKKYVERDDIDLIRTIAKNAGLTKNDRSIEQFIQDVSIRAIKQIIDPENKTAKNTQNKPVIEKQIIKKEIEQIKILTEAAHLTGNRTDEQLIDDFSRGIFKRRLTQTEIIQPPQKEEIENLNLEQVPSEEEAKDLKQDQELADQDRKTQAEVKSEELPVPPQEEQSESVNEKKSEDLMKPPDVISEAERFKPDSKAYDEFTELIEKQLSKIDPDLNEYPKHPIEEGEYIPGYDAVARAAAASEELQKIENRNLKAKAEKEEEKNSLAQEGQEFDLGNEHQDLAQAQKEAKEQPSQPIEEIKETPIDVTQLEIPDSPKVEAKQLSPIPTTKASQDVTSPQTKKAPEDILKKNISQADKELDLPAPPLKSSPGHAETKLMAEEVIKPITLPEEPVKTVSAAPPIPTEISKTNDDLIAALKQEKPSITIEMKENPSVEEIRKTHNQAKSTLVHGFYEKLIGKPYDKGNSNDYETAIFNIFNAVCDLNFEEVDAWMNMILNPSNQLTVLANAYRLAKALQTSLPTNLKLPPDLALKSRILDKIPQLEERIQNIELEDVSKIDLDQLKWDLSKEPYGLIYESFFKATGKQFNKDAATTDRLDEFIYDFFSFTEDGDLGELKNQYDKYLQRDDLYNQLTILNAALPMPAEFRKAAGDKQKELREIIPRDDGIAKKLKTLDKYIEKLNAVEGFIQNKVQEIEGKIAAASSFIGKESVPQVHYKKENATALIEFFEKEKATEQRTRSILKMAFAIFTIFGTYTQPMFKHLERQPLEFQDDSMTIDIGDEILTGNTELFNKTDILDDASGRLAISDRPHWQEPPLPTASVPEGKIELNKILFDLPEHSPPQAKIFPAIAATAENPPVRHTPRVSEIELAPTKHMLDMLEEQEFFEGPTVFRMVDQYGVLIKPPEYNIPLTLPSPPPMINQMHNVRSFPLQGGFIAGGLLGAIIPLAAIAEKTVNFVTGYFKEQVAPEIDNPLFKKESQAPVGAEAEVAAPREPELVVAPREAMAEPAVVGPLPDQVDEREEVKQFFTQQLRERPQEILNEIKPTLSSLSAYKELLGYAINETATDPEVSQTLFNYIQRELESKSPVAVDLAADLLEKFVQAQVESGNADRVLENAFNFKDQYQAIRMARYVTSSWDDETFIQKIKNKSPDQVLLMLKGAVLDISPDSLFELIREVAKRGQTQAHPILSELIRFCGAHHQKLLEPLSEKITPQQLQSPGFYQFLKNNIKNALSNIKNMEIKETALSLPFEQQLMSVVTQIIDAEGKEGAQFELARNEFKALALENLEATMQVLKQLKPYGLEQSHLNQLISPELIQSLNPNQSGLFENIYERIGRNASSFDDMVANTLIHWSAEGIETALESLRNQKGEANKRAALENVWSGPEYLKENRSKMGLQVYARISYDLLFPYIQEQLQFDAQGKLTTPENDPIRMLHKLVCQKYINETPREEIINMILLNHGQFRGTEETHDTIRDMMIAADPQVIVDLLESYLRQMSQGDTPRAKSAETELMQHLKKVDAAGLPKVIEKAFNEGSVKGSLLAENLFVSIANYEIALDVFERCVRSPNQDPKVIRKMANRLYELSGGRSQKISEVSELVERSIQGFIQSGVRSNLLAGSLVELLIDRDPKKAADVIRSTLAAKLPFFHTQMDSLLDKLAEKSLEISWGLIPDLFKHENIEIKASGSLLFSKILASDPSKLIMVQPKDTLVVKQPFKYLHQKAGAATGVNLIDETAIIKEISSNPQKALTDIMSLLNNPSLRSQNQGAMLLSTLIIEKGKNLAFAKTIMKELTGLSDAQLQLEMAALIAKLHEKEPKNKSLESFLHDKNRDLSKLFFEGFACINPDAEVFNGYLQGIKRKGEDIQHYLVVLKKYSPETAKELASILKQSLSSTERNAGEFLASKNIQQASLTTFKANLISRIEHLMREPEARTAIEEECLVLFEENPGEFSLIMKQLANEIPDTDEAVSAISFPLMKTIENIDNPAILKRLIALHMKEAMSKFKEANVQPHDEQSRIRKFVSLSINPLKALIANHPYQVLEAISQYLPVDYLREAIYRELIPVLGKQPVLGQQIEVKVPAGIDGFIEKIFVDMLGLNQPNLALEVANHYADVAKNPRALQRMVDRLSTISQEPAFKEKLTDVAFKCVKLFIEQEGDGKPIAPIVDWLIDNHSGKAFQLIFDDLANPKPLLEKNLKDLTVHLAYQELSFAPILFKKMIEHKNLNVRAAAADLYLTMERLQTIEKAGAKKPWEAITGKVIAEDVKVRAPEPEIIPQSEIDSINALLPLIQQEDLQIRSGAKEQLERELEKIDVLSLPKHVIESFKNAGINTEKLLKQNILEFTQYQTIENLQTIVKTGDKKTQKYEASAGESYGKPKDIEAIESFNNADIDTERLLEDGDIERAIWTKSEDKINSLLEQLETQNGEAAELTKRELQTELKNIFIISPHLLLENFQNSGIDNKVVLMAAVEVFCIFSQQNNPLVLEVVEGLKKLLAKVPVQEYPTIVGPVLNAGGKKGIDFAKYILKKLIAGSNISNASIVLSELENKKLISPYEIMSIIYEEAAKIGTDPKGKATIRTINFLSKRLAQKTSKEEFIPFYKEIFDIEPFGVNQNEARKIMLSRLLDRILEEPEGMEFAKKLVEYVILKNDVEVAADILSTINQIQSPEAGEISNMIDAFMQQNGPLLILENPDLTQDQIEEIITIEYLKRINSSQEIQRMLVLIQNNPMIEQTIADLCEQKISESLPVLRQLQISSTVQKWQEDVKPIILDSIATEAKELRIFTKFSYGLVTSQIEKLMIEEEDNFTKANLKLMLEAVCKDLMNDFSSEEIHSILEHISTIPERRLTFEILSSLFNKMYAVANLTSQFEDIHLEFELSQEMSFEKLSEEQDKLSQIQAELQSLNDTYEDKKPQDLLTLTNAVNELAVSIAQKKDLALPDEFAKILNEWADLKKELQNPKPPIFERLNEITRTFTTSIDKVLPLLREYAKHRGDEPNNFEVDLLAEMQTISSMITDIEERTKASKPIEIVDIPTVLQTNKQRIDEINKLLKDIPQDKVDELVYKHDLLRSKIKVNEAKIAALKERINNRKQDSDITEDTRKGLLETYDREIAEIEVDLKQNKFQEQVILKTILPKTQEMQFRVWISLNEELAALKQNESDTTVTQTNEASEPVREEKSIEKQIEEISINLQGVDKRLTDNLTWRVKQLDTEISHIDNPPKTLKIKNSFQQADEKRELSPQEKESIKQEKLSKKRELLETNVATSENSLSFKMFLELQAKLNPLKQSKAYSDLEPLRTFFTLNKDSLNELFIKDSLDTNHDLILQLKQHLDSIKQMIVLSKESQFLINEIKKIPKLQNANQYILEALKDVVEKYSGTKTYTPVQIVVPQRQAKTSVIEFPDILTATSLEKLELDAMALNQKKVATDIKNEQFYNICEKLIDEIKKNPDTVQLIIGVLFKVIGFLQSISDLRVESNLKRLFGLLGSELVNNLSSENAQLLVNNIENNQDARKYVYQSLKDQSSILIPEPFKPLIVAEEAKEFAQIHSAYATHSIGEMNFEAVTEILGGYASRESRYTNQIIDLITTKIKEGLKIVVPDESTDINVDGVEKLNKLIDFQFNITPYNEQKYFTAFRAAAKEFMDAATANAFLAAGQNYTGHLNEDLKKILEEISKS